jgi:HlyD family secretion protein
MNRSTPWMYGIGAAIVLSLLPIAIVLYLNRPMPGPQQVHANEPMQSVGDDDAVSTPAVLAVDVVHPRRGMDYEIEQPGSVHAYVTVHLRAKVSGFLAWQKVDIGDRVKKDQKLAVIAVPELDKELQRNLAAIELAEARVKQAQAKVVSARAAKEAAEAKVIEADANHASAVKWVVYRKLVRDRIKALFDTNSIEEKVLDEKMELYEASRETERAAKAAMVTSAANVTAAAAMIEQAEADVAAARSGVKLAQAEMEKTEVQIDYATLTAPFDGTISERNFFEKDFIRSASEGTGQLPLLTVQRTDKLRVVVKVPDSAVPYLDKGDTAIVRIDSLPGRKFKGVVSRKADSEDPDTRLMKVEVDLPNPTGEIGDGMYGRVKILLDQFPKLLSVPSTSLVKARDGRWMVPVVRDDDHIHFAEVRVHKDNGTRVCLDFGLRKEDRVVLNPTGNLTEGTEVQARLVEDAPPVSDAER